MPVANGWRPLQPPRRSRPVVGAGPFARLAAAHGLSVAGDTLVTLALAGSVFFSISPSEARGRVALSLVITMAPFAVLAPLLGPAIDRSRRGRRATVVAANLGRALTCLAMAPQLRSLLLFPLAFALLVLAKAYSVAKSSLVPSAVDHADELVEANAKLAIVGGLAGFVAAVPGVVVLRFLDAAWVLRLAAVVFALGAIAALRIEERRPPGHHTGDTPEDRADPEARIDLPASIAVAAAAMATLRGVVGFLTFLVAFAFRRMGAPSWWFGIVLVASVAAGLGGAAASPRLRGLLTEERMLAGGLGLAAACGLALAGQGSWPWAAMMAAIVALAASAAKQAFDAIVQRDAPEAVRGRSFARFEAMFQLAWVVGALLPVLVGMRLGFGYASIGVVCGLATAGYLVVGHRLGAGTDRPLD